MGEELRSQKAMKQTLPGLKKRKTKSTVEENRGVSCPRKQNPGNRKWISP